MEKLAVRRSRDFSEEKSQKRKLVVEILGVGTFTTISIYSKKQKPESFELTLLRGEREYLSLFRLEYECWKSQRFQNLISIINSKFRKSYPLKNCELF